MYLERDLPAVEDRIVGLSDGSQCVVGNRGERGGTVAIFYAR